MSTVSTAASASAVQSVPLLKQDPASFSCQNRGCPDYTLLGRGNINLYARYGRKEVRLFICSSCGSTFSELRGTPMWDSRLDFAQVAIIFTHLVDGCSIRGAARSENGNGKMCMSKNTVKRYLRLAMLNPVEVWSFIQPLVAFDYQRYLHMLGLRATDVVERAQHASPQPKLNATKQQTVDLARAFLRNFKWQPGHPTTPRS